MLLRSGTTHAKTDIEEAVLDRAVVARRGPAKLRIVAPRAATYRPTALIPRCNPSPSINGGILITVVPNILAPFPNIAMHVMEAKVVSREAANDCRFLSINT